MINVNKKFERLEKLKSVIKNKLDHLSLNGDEEAKMFFDKFEDERNNFQFDLDKILASKDLDEGCFNKININNPKKPKPINTNKIERTCKKDTEVLSMNKLISQNIEKENKQLNPISELSNSEMNKININKIHETESRKHTIISFRPIDNVPNNQEKTKNDKHITNELTYLKLNLNKIKTKNNLLQKLLKNDMSVKNCNFLDKVMFNFVEKLAVNWNEVVNLILDELFEEEILHLNELEMSRINSQRKDQTNENIIPSTRVPNFNNTNNISNPYNKQENDKECVYEINKLLQDYKFQEEEIFNKYILKN